MSWTSRSCGALAPSLAVLALVFLAVQAPVAAQEQQPERSGFTLLLNLGLGLQNDQALDESATAIGGLNLGIGAFLNERTALWFRVSGTTANYDIGIADFNQTSGFAGPAVQYWVNERVALEGGVGAGFWDVEDANETGLGVLVGGTFVFWTNGGHNLSLGLEYAPAFTDPDTVHNFGFVFGWQLN